MEHKFNVIFSEAEAQAMLSLLHLAVKAAGLEGPHAANAVHFQQKINSAHAESKRPDLSVGAIPDSALDKSQ